MKHTEHLYELFNELVTWWMNWTYFKLDALWHIGNWKNYDRIFANIQCDHNWWRPMIVLILHWNWYLILSLHTIAIAALSKQVLHCNILWSNSILGCRLHGPGHDSGHLGPIKEILGPLMLHLTSPGLIKSAIRPVVRGVSHWWMCEQNFSG